MPQLAPQQPPPADYYADNVRTLLTHVLEFHGDLLCGAERDFAQRLLGASTQAQRLFARLMTRRGPWIRIDKLSYREVADTHAAVGELEGLALVSRNPRAPADALLAGLTNPERRELFPAVRGATKTAWIVNCVTRHSDLHIVSRLAGTHPWVTVAAWRELRLCQLLFFGDDHQDTSTFVLQDLGVVSYARYALNRAARLFASRDAIERHLLLRRFSSLSRRLTEHPELASWLSEQLWMASENRHEQRQLDRILNRLGRWHERRGDYDEALACYARSRSHPARERRVRLLRKLGDEQGACTLARHMGKAPRSAEEEDFANRFPQRQQALPIETTTVSLPASLEVIRTTPVEQHAADLLSAAGGVVWHLENQLPLGLAGLAFWDVIFAPVEGAFVNPFQTGPLDLFWPDFATTRAQPLGEALSRLQDPAAFAQTVLGTLERQAGIANRFVSWRHWSRERLELLLEQIPARVLLGIAEHVIRQPHRARTGFPDLTVLYGRGGFEFVEVKSPNDQLQPAQRVWLKTLADLSCPARVLKFKP